EDGSAEAVDGTALGVGAHPRGKERLGPEAGALDEVTGAEGVDRHAAGEERQPEQRLARTPVAGQPATEVLAGGEDEHLAAQGVPAGGLDGDDPAPGAADP